MKILLILAYFVFLYMITVIAKKCGEVDMLKQQRELLELQIKLLNGDILFFKKEAMRLQKNNLGNQEEKKEILEAVRKAMIFSHPDKGFENTTDNFIKYKELYDKLKKEI